MLEIQVIKTLNKYLNIVFQQAKTHGKDALKAKDHADVRSLTFIIGFESPDGAWGINIRTIKSAFVTKEWREDSPIILPSGAVVSKVTHFHPDTVGLFAEKVGKALKDGNALYLKNKGSYA